MQFGGIEMKEKRKFYQKKWFLWLWLIIFPPVGIILLWSVHKAMKKGTKIVLSVIFALWFLLLMAGMSGDSSDRPANAPINSTPPIEQNEQTKGVKGDETVPHRDGMYGVSDKDIDRLDIDSQFTVSDVRNDVTGNWRISVVDKSMNFEEYALSYYNKYFADDNEIHAIVNFASSTTTKITVAGDKLDITVYEYVKDEEHDAKKLFGGMLNSEYCVYLDNGDIDKIGENTFSAGNSDVVQDPGVFLKDIKISVEGDVGQGESITDISLEDRDLCVYVDLSGADPSPLTLEDLAISRTSSITDDILALREYDGLWDTITVDFGDIGKIVNHKSNIQTNIGGRYFQSKNWVLE